MGTACSQPERSCNCPQSSCCKQSLVRVKDIIKQVPLLERHRRIVHYDQVPVTDHYQILPGRDGVIHQGAFNIVYKAKHKRSNILRALKQVSKQEVNMTQWNNEVEVMQCCDHPNICRLYETFSDGKVLSQVMELCTGVDLLGFPTAGKQMLTEANAAWLVRQMVGAIGHLHAKGICHAELKPECFTFTSKFSKKPSLHDLFLKLTDIGLAVAFGKGARVPAKRQLDSAGKGKLNLNVTKFGRSKAYCQAPEQAHGESHGDNITWAIQGDKCDIWALGAITFFVVSGRWPTSKTGVNAKELPKDLSPGSGEFIARCLVCDPQGRSTANELRDDAWMVMALEAYEVSLAAAQDKHLSTGKRCIMDAPLMNADSVLKGFQQMSKLNEFERAAVTAVAHHLPEDKTAHLRKIFQKLDVNGDGTLTAEELHRGLVDVIGCENEFQKLLAYIDTDGSGCIDYTEFIAATYTLKSSLKDEICEAAFRVFDTDGSGAVTLNEVNEALGESIPMEELKELMAKADKENLDGELDIGEFKRLLFQDMKGGAASKKVAAHSYAHSLRPPRSSVIKPECSPRMSEIQARNARSPRPIRKVDDGMQQQQTDSTDAFNTATSATSASVITQQASEKLSSEEVGSEQRDDLEKAGPTSNEKGGFLRSFTQKMAGKEGVLGKLKRAFTGQVVSPSENEAKEKRKKKKGSPSASPSASPKTSPSSSPKSSPRQTNASKQSPRGGRAKAKAKSKEKDDVHENEEVPLKTWDDLKGVEVVGVLPGNVTCEGLLNPPQDGIYGDTSPRSQGSPRQRKNRLSAQRGDGKVLSEATRAMMNQWEEDNAVAEYIRNGRAPLANAVCRPQQSEKGGMLFLSNSNIDSEDHADRSSRSPRRMSLDRSDPQAKGAARRPSKRTEKTGADSRGCSPPMSATRRSVAEVAALASVSRPSMDLSPRKSPRVSMQSADLGLVSPRAPSRRGVR